MAKKKNKKIDDPCPRVHPEHMVLSEANLKLIRQDKPAFVTIRCGGKEYKKRVGRAHVKTIRPTKANGLAKTMHVVGYYWRSDLKTIGLQNYAAERKREQRMRDRRPGQTRRSRK